MKALTLRLREEDYEQLRALAFVERRAMSEVVREAIRGYVERRMRQSDIRRAMEHILAEYARDQQEGEGTCDKE